MSSTPASFTPAVTHFYTSIPAEEGASVKDGAGVEGVSLVYTGTLVYTRTSGVDYELPV